MAEVHGNQTSHERAFWPLRAQECRRLFEPCLFYFHAVWAGNANTQQEPICKMMMFAADYENVRYSSTRIFSLSRRGIEFHLEINMIFERGHPDHPGWFLFIEFRSNLRYVPSWELTYPIQKAVGKMISLSHWWDMYRYVNSLEGKLMMKDLLSFYYPPGKDHRSRTQQTLWVQDFLFPRWDMFIFRGVIFLDINSIDNWGTNQDLVVRSSLS